MCKLKKSSGYSCCLPGCPYNADRHKSYVKHLKQIHPNYHILSCQFRHNCKREFSSVELLKEHVKLDHNLKDAETPSGQLPAVNVATKCDMVSCGGCKFDNTQLLMRHINIDHLREPRHCIFEDCLILILHQEIISGLSI